MKYFYHIALINIHYAIKVSSKHYDVYIVFAMITYDSYLVQRLIIINNEYSDIH